MKQLKKKKSKAPEELEQIEKALAETTSHDSSREHHFSLKDAWSFWLIWWLTLLLWYFVFHSLSIIYLVIAWFILSMALENVVIWMQKRMRRGMAIFVAYIILIAFVLSGVIIVIPFVVQQVADIINIIIVKINFIQDVIQNEWLASLIEKSFLPTQIKTSFLVSLDNGDRVNGIQSALLDNMSQIVTTGTEYIKNAGGVAVSLISWLFSWLTQIAIVLITAVFFSIEKEKVVHFLAQISGNVKYTELRLLKLYKQLWYRLKGQLILCIIIGIMTWLWLWILSRFGLDIESKFTLALIAWLTEFIPYVGPILWMLPALLIGGISFGWTGIFAIIILYLIIQQSEGNILVPMVMHRTLGVSPLLIFLCMILWGSLFGFLWVVLAVPLAVIMKILFENYN